MPGPGMKAAKDGHDHHFRKKTRKVHPLSGNYPIGMHSLSSGQDERRNGRGVTPAFWADALTENERWLRRIIRLRVGENQAVEEVWQEVACQVVRSHTITPPVNVGAWLY